MTMHAAATLAAPRAPLTVTEVETPAPAADEVLVRIRAAAINPVDWVIQGTGRITYRWLRTPAVLGSDIAGEVIAVGADVTRFRVGQRVFGLATGTDRGRDPLREGAFQHSSILLERLTAPTPESLTDAEAAVFPLGLSTAACALFQPQHLGLRMPGTPASAAAPEVVVVWGGSTSVGMNAIQLARAAGYTVVSTASAKNAEVVSALGAEAVVDHGSPSAVADMVAAVGGRPVAGAVALGAGSTDACLDVLSRTGGTRLAMASTPVSLDSLAGGRHLFPAMLPVFTRIGLATVRSSLRARRLGIHAGFVWGNSLRDDEMGPRLWRETVPRMLADGSLRPAPSPLVVGDGLEAVQGALDRQRAGVSAQKVVVRL
ncbi:zinc-binding alcohol dehydrogenase family protein [Microbacterium sp. NPDC089190]|uniref:zinc-binding alcohol dehydrogenase family protein n=1 Tax=Microbacterium sp. NPDC089190 TaxID=3155063 RepID=UPI00344B6E52